MLRDGEDLHVPEERGVALLPVADEGRGDLGAAQVPTHARHVCEPLLQLGREEAAHRPAVLRVVRPVVGS